MPKPARYPVQRATEWTAWVHALHISTLQCTSVLAAECTLGFRLTLRGSKGRVLEVSLRRNKPVLVFHAGLCCLGSLVDRSLPRVGVLALTCVLCFPFVSKLQEPFG